MDKQTHVIVRRFAGELKKLIQVEQLILFGSRARGDHSKWSDFDVVVVSPDFRGIPFPRRPGRLFDVWPHPFDLEALCYTPGEWRLLRNNRGILLKAQSEGVRVL